MSSKEDKQKIEELLNRIENGIGSLTGIYHAIITMANLPEQGRSNIDNLFVTYLDETVKAIKQLKNKLDIDEKE